jgi:hypothetical protein
VIDDSVFVDIGIVDDPTLWSLEAFPRRIGVGHQPKKLKEDSA